MVKIEAAGSVLAGLAEALASGTVRVVDLTMPLGAETPVLPLPDPWPKAGVCDVRGNG